MRRYRHRPGLVQFSMGPDSSIPAANPLGAELVSLLGWCLPGGAVAGLLVGGLLLAAGPGPGALSAALTFVLLWGLLGVAAGLGAAGLRLLLTG